MYYMPCGMNLCKACMEDNHQDCKECFPTACCDEHKVELVDDVCPECEDECAGCSEKKKVIEMESHYDGVDGTDLYCKDCVNSDW